MTMTLSRPLLFLLLLYRVCSYNFTGKADKKEELVGDYLYGSDDPESVFPITEYVLASLDSAEDAKNETTLDRPDFLYSDKSGNRIVEFYAPWCFHCREFKKHFISLARTVSKMVHKHGREISFHAVSCTAHRPICRDQNVTGYPRLKVFKAGSINATTFGAGNVHPLLILDALGISRTDVQYEVEEEEPQVEAQLEKKGLRVKEQKKKKIQRVRNKGELYRDISASFDFAMRNGIFTLKSPMKNDTKDAFIDWIDLLQQTLPPTLKVHKVVTSIQDQVDKVLLAEKNLIEVVDKHPLEQKGWSFACTHGDKYAGYTCGLWELFHLMTIGVVEWNDYAGDDDWSLWPPGDAADILRNYIENFFGCEVCRLNFLSMYDACSHDRCVRLPSTANGTTHTQWIQFPLWLWEVHNSVNLRLMKERAEKEKIKVTHQDELDAIWPSRSECSRCWRPDGSWDEDAVYKFLRLEYWPYDATSELYRRDLLVEDKPDDSDDSESSSSMKWFLPLGAGSLFLIWSYVEKRERDKSGRHKRDC